MTKNTNNQNLNTFLENNKNNQIILYGAGSRGVRVFYNLISKGFKKQQFLFCDSNPKLWNTMLCGIKIISFDELKLFSPDTCLIISSSVRYEIIPKLQESGFNNIHYFHSLLFAEQMYEKFDSNFLRIIEEIGDNRGADNDEQYTLYSSLKSMKNLSGDVAEVGVYKGGTSKLLCESKGKKNLYLFDTFEGLPKTKEYDLFVQSGWLHDTSVDSVKKYLEKYKNVYFFKGIFPETANSILDKKFCFVHLDANLYQSTIDSLEFFWPRMVKGGRIVSHDYKTNSMPGITKAFQEFFKNEPEKIIEIADSQVMVIK